MITKVDTNPITVVNLTGSGGRTVGFGSIHINKITQGQGHFTIKKDTRVNERE